MWSFAASTVSYKPYENTCLIRVHLKKIIQTINLIIQILLTFSEYHYRTNAPAYEDLWTEIITLRMVDEEHAGPIINSPKPLYSAIA